MVAQVGGWSLRLGQLILHLNRALAVIVLQIVMVSPETHLVKAWVPVHNQWVPVKKKKNKESEIENAWAFM